MITVSEILLSKKWLPLVLVIIILAGIASRIVYINADAPQDISISAAIYTDEGFKTYSPRNKVLFGNWKWTPEDEYRSWVNSSPVATGAYTWIFNHLGVSFHTIRSLSILYGVMTILLMSLFLLHCYGVNTALVGTAFFSMNFFVIMFNRLGLYETHLLLYAALTFVLMYGAWNLWRRTFPLKNSQSRITLLFAILFIILLIAGAATSFITGFYIKKSITLILVAIIPAIILSMTTLNGSLNTRRPIIFSTIIAFIFIFYLLFAHLSFLHTHLGSIFNIRILGTKLGSILPLRDLAPLYVFVGKGLYREFIFLQPVMLFFAFYYSVYTFYRFAYRQGPVSVDLFLASWFFFGLVLLMMLKYNPARYFLMLSVPAAILSARGLYTLAAARFSDFRREPRPFTIKLVLAIASFFAVLYSAVILYVHIIPFSIRNTLYDMVYPHAIAGNLDKALPVLIPVGGGVILVAFLFFLFRKKISNWIFSPSSAVTLLLIIIVFHVFQTGRWIITHDNNLYTVSTELGDALPENAVIAGSWSAGLVCENSMRALIIQSKNTYNYALFKKIINNQPVSVHRLKEGNPVREQETNIPLYFAVSPNVIFEKKIVQEFGEFIRPDRLIRNVRLGYFDLQIYRIR
ncbi:MAG: hypothetical protein ACOCWZ_11575 [Spirochaetota bacterium]